MASSLLAGFDEHLERFSIQHNRTTNYHPQSNGMDERVNGTLVKIIKSYIDDNKADWDKTLKWATFVYNTAPHESIGMSPYMAMYGVRPRTPLNLEPSKELPLDKAREMVRSELARNSKRAQDTMKEFYDRSRVPSEFQVADWVLVRNKGRIVHESKKLQPKWKGPGVILRLPQSETDDDPRYAEVLLFQPTPHTLKSPLSDIVAYHRRNIEGLEDIIAPSQHKVADIIRSKMPQAIATCPEVDFDLALEEDGPNVERPSPTVQSEPNRGPRLSVVDRRVRFAEPPEQPSFEFDEAAGSTPIHEPEEEGRHQTLEPIAEESAAPAAPSPTSSSTRIPVATSTRILRSRAAIKPPDKYGSHGKLSR